MLLESTFQIKARLPGSNNLNKILERETEMS